MKKVLNVLIVLLCLLLITGCGSNKSEESSNDSSSKKEQEVEKVFEGVKTCTNSFSDSSKVIDIKYEANVYDKDVKSFVSTKNVKFSNTKNLNFLYSLYKKSADNYNKVDGIEMNLDKGKDYIIVTISVDYSNLNVDAALDADKTSDYISLFKSNMTYEEFTKQLFGYTCEE